MVKKKKVTQDKIIELYMDAVSDSKNPDSISSFAKENNFAEEDFYKHYSDFKELEKSIFVSEVFIILFPIEL